MFSGVLFRIQVDGQVVHKVQVRDHHAAGPVVGDAKIGFVKFALEQCVIIVALEIKKKK
jgi:hypothetical protein